MAVPLIAALGVNHQEKHRLEAQLSEYEQKTELEKEVTVFSLKDAKNAGEVIEKNDLKEVSVRVSQTTVISNLKEDALVGKRCKIQLKKGAILQPDVLYEGEEITRDVRYHTLDFVEVPSHLTEGDLVDIRIFFPTGEDYVVVSHRTLKKVTSESEKDVEDEQSSYGILVTEKELLHLASACVDLQTFDGVRVYAVKYAGEFQEAAVVNYPVNQTVFDLLNWDPNVIQSQMNEETQEQRAMMEEHLVNQTGSETEGTQTATADREEILELFQ